jgi:hypothetical protein
MIGGIFMRIKTLALLLALAIVFIGLAGCEHTISFKDPAAQRKEDISNLIAGEVAAKTGETYQTKWFEFTVQSIEKVSEHLGYKAKEGHRLYKIPVTLKNTWNGAIPMGLFDFYMDAPDFDEYIWAIPPLDGSMMPEKFDLQPGETVQYLMIFEVPANAADLSLSYTENYEGGNDGATYSIRIK